MDVLILGGTKFVGRHIAKAFVTAGAHVTLFNRGNKYGDPVHGVTQVHGDRRSDLHRLGERLWDAVIDTSAYVPSDAERAARYFATRTGQYVFVSTISVYDPERTGRVDEDAPLALLDGNADRTRMTPETYGALKAACERLILSTFRHRAAILRPGLVAGPHDPTDRFSYWPVRVAEGGDVLLPHKPGHPIQFIDARDLASFAVTLAQSSRGGTFNVVTTPGSTTFGDLFVGCIRASRALANAVYTGEQELLDANVAPWSELPLWLPSFWPVSQIAKAPNVRARIAGLNQRPIYETALDVLAWARTAGKRRSRLIAGLSAGREQRLLASRAK